MTALAGTLSLVALATGCAHSSFIPSSDLAVAARPKDCHIDIVFDGKPTRPYEVIGRVATDSTAPGLFALDENQDKAFERMREKACEVGGHVLFGIGTGSNGQWNDDGYSRSTQGAAIVAVYVDPSGSVLPAPRSGRAPN
ncbi:MAG: hypothetical protein AAFZ18_20050 [Myxococcota bacterium]